MAIKYQIESRDSLLTVKAEGIDDNLQDVLSYANAVMESAVRHASKKILCDERGLEYAISMIDTYMLAEEASKFAVNCAKIAIICQEKYLKDARFYETVAANRGLIVRVTADYNNAIDWLNA